jgi:hypothetical protein
MGDLSARIFEEFKQSLPGVVCAQEASHCAVFEFLCFKWGMVEGDGGSVNYAMLARWEIETLGSFSFGSRIAQSRGFPSA